MEQFGALETKTQYSLLNNLDIHSLQLMCIHRGLNIRGIDKKYDLILMFIQWYNNIKYLEYRGVRGLVACERGPRKQMEDDYILYSNGGISLYGVFDGHGGSYISKRLRNSITNILVPRLKVSGDLQKIITDTFVDIDKEYYNQWRRNLFGTDGSTASIVIQKQNILYFVNLGDSRTVLYDSNGGVFYSTTDHKPAHSTERERITSTRYDVITTDVPRIGGLLAVSRSFGDFIYKIDERDVYNPQYAVSTVPDIHRIDISTIIGDRLIVSATDGLWDVFTNEEVYRFIQTHKKKGMAYKTIFRNLINSAYTKGSTDNISIVYVEL